MKVRALPLLPNEFLTDSLQSYEEPMQNQNDKQAPINQFHEQLLRQVDKPPVSAQKWNEKPEPKKHIDAPDWDLLMD